MQISMFSIVVFLSLFALSIVILFFSVYFLVRMIKIFANIENNSEAAIEIIDHQYSKMISIIDNSGFLMDEPMIQDFVREFGNLKGEVRSQVSELFLSKYEFEEVEIHE